MQGYRNFSIHWSIRFVQLWTLPQHRRSRFSGSVSRLTSFGVLTLATVRAGHLGRTSFWRAIYRYGFITLSFLADRTISLALMLQCCVFRLSSLCLSVTLCIVAKRCVLEQKLLLTAYRKSFMRNRLMPKWMTLTFI